MVPASHDPVIRHRVALIAQKKPPQRVAFFFQLSGCTHAKESIPAAEQTEQKKKQIDEVQVQARCS